MYEQASADDNPLVTEISDEFEASAECFHVPGQAADRGTLDLAVLDLAVLDLADARCGNTRLLGDLPLGEVPGLADLGELVRADLGAELILQLTDLILVPGGEQLVLDIGPLVSGTVLLDDTRGPSTLAWSGSWPRSAP